MDDVLYPYAGRRAPLRLWGPIGAVRLAERMRSAFEDDIRVRMADENVPEAATAIEAREFAEAGGRVFEEAGVVVTAFPVNHGPLIRPSVGYRVDHAGRSVLLSGDTKYDENVIRHGTGVDLLLHEVCAIPAEVLRTTPAAVAIAEHHTSPEEAGRVFAAARPRLAAYTHIVQTTRPPVPTVPLQQIEAETRRTYDGPLVLGQDLDRFVLADAGVRLQRGDAARQREEPGVPVGDRADVDGDLRIGGDPCGELAQDELRVPSLTTNSPLLPRLVAGPGRGPVRPRVGDRASAGLLSPRRVAPDSCGAGESTPGSRR